MALTDRTPKATARPNRLIACCVGLAASVAFVGALVYAGAWDQVGRDRAAKAVEHLAGMRIKQSTQPRWVARTVSGKPLCSDTCFKARDGVCDEGGRSMGEDPATYKELLCDLGTDCSDCGPWEGHLPPDTWPEGGPVTYLRQSQDVELYVKTTVTQPPIQMVYTHPKKDTDVSAHIHHYGVLEGGITEVFRLALSEQCVDPATGERRLVLDVGANFGYFAVYAAKLGCKVIAWEPVPHFRAILHLLTALNNVTGLVEVRDTVVAATDNASMTISVPRRGIWGTASVGGINEFPGTEPRHVDVVSERVDSVVDQDVLLMKVDVEGYEPIVFQSAAQLLARRTVTHVVFEYNTGVAERTHESSSPHMIKLVLQNPQMLMRFVQLGYKMGLMHDGLAKWPFRGGVFPALTEITASMLEYDIKDAHAYMAAAEALVARQPTPHVLGCPAHPELMDLNKGWAYCLSMPYNAHPKSFRSSFGYNTNIWASKDPNLLKLEGVAAAFPLEQNAATEWFVRGDHGVGGRFCGSLPGEQLVRSRCPCEFSVKQKHAANVTAECNKEAAVVQRLQAEGRIAFKDFQYPTPLAAGRRRS